VGEGSIAIQFIHSLFADERQLSEPKTEAATSAAIA
jgi:hypothetical protein